MIYLSFDQDWAPAWATEDLCTAVAAADQRGTFFVTHDCPSLEVLRSSGRFELGWHPNYLPGSSHGEEVEAVLNTMHALVPKAVGARAHGLITGTSYLLAYGARGLRYDASELRDGVHDLEVFTSWTGVQQIPIFFEDDVHFARGRTCRLDRLELDRPGLKVFNFHPILLALNASDTSGYKALKQSLTSRGLSLNEATREDVAAFTQADAPGVGDLFRELLSWLERNPGQAGGTLSELC